MKVIKKIRGMIVNRPLLSYIFVVMILSVLEFANYFIQYIPVAVFLVLGFVRAFFAFKIVDYINILKNKACGPDVEDYILKRCKKHNTVAMLSYNALAIICSVDAIVSTVSAIRGFYGYASAFVVFLVLEQLLDFIGITSLVLQYSSRMGYIFKVEEMWLISNVVMLILVLVACSHMAERDSGMSFMSFVGFVICAIVSSCYRLIYADDVESNLKKYSAENKE